MKLVALLLGFLLLLLISQYLNILISSPVAAQTMSNDNYILQLEDIDTNTKYPEPTVKKSDTLGVTSKIPARKQSKPFLFSISQTLIDFSILSPANPIKRSNELTVSKGSANGYSIFAFEDKEISSVSPSAFIPDTTCDNGQCSETSSAPWTNPLTYGFGYRCDNLIGTDCMSGFSEADFYKQFANASMSEIPQKIMASTNNKSNNSVQITYKINIPGAQPFALYSNTITFIAIPNF